MRKVREAIKDQDREAAAADAPRPLPRRSTRSVKKGAIKKNTGSRYKSRLSRQVALLSPTPAK